MTEPRRVPPLIRNLFDSSPFGQGHEVIVPLLSQPGFRLEQIISFGQSTPDGTWYDQRQPEWVLLAQGHACLAFDDGTLAKLIAGDSLLIPAHVRHRVEQCSQDAVWLALHFDAAGNAQQ